MPTRFTNRVKQAFSVPSLQWRSSRSLPTRLLNEPQPPEGGTLSACFVYALIFVLSAMQALAQTPSLPDLSGRMVNPLAATQQKALVFLFVRTDCPISNRYATEWQRLRRQFSNAGIGFWLVYPNEEAAVIARHVKEFGYDQTHVLRDPQQALVKMTGVEVTPEATVFTFDKAAPRLVYRGRIDDRVVAFGQQRTRATQRDLADVLTAIQRGAQPAFKSQPAIGCYIMKADEK